MDQESQPSFRPSDNQAEALRQGGTRPLKSSTTGSSRTAARKALLNSAGFKQLLVARVHELAFERDQTKTVKLFFCMGPREDKQWRTELMQPLDTSAHYAAARVVLTDDLTSHPKGRIPQHRRPSL